jgi:hypothetical protein
MGKIVNTSINAGKAKARKGFEESAAQSRREKNRFLKHGY